MSQGSCRPSSRVAMLTTADSEDAGSFLPAAYRADTRTVAKPSPDASSKSKGRLTPRKHQAPPSTPMRR